MNGSDDTPKIGRREATGGLIASILTLPMTLAAGTASARDVDAIWNSGRIFVGNSPADQIPSPFIECPLFFENGTFAGAFHALDLSDLPTTGQVRGTISHGAETIEPDFGASIAAAVTQGSDGPLYLLVGGEGTVTDGRGFFRGVSRAIVRCKYKVAVGSHGEPLLISCVDCVVILVRR